jgi:hypothetical protein
MPAKGVVELPIVPASRASHRVARELPPYQRFQRDFPDFTDKMNGLRKAFTRDCERLGGLDQRSQRGAIRQLLRNRQFFPLFAFDALKRCDEFAHANPGVVEALAEQFDPFNPIEDEPVIIRDVAPRSSRTRHVMDFGPKRRMHQQTIARIVRHTHSPLENQKLFHGGMPTALSAIEAAISAGATHAMEVDFVNFYSSVRLDGLVEVMRPLPASVTSHVIWDETWRNGDLLVNAAPSSHHATPEIPTGLPLGSSTSPIVGEVLIARLLEAAQLPDIITYADNLCVLGRSEEEVLERFHTLQTVLRNLPFACISGLSMASNEIRNVIEREKPSKFGIEFANHESIVAQCAEGVVSIGGWRPSAAKLQDFQISASDHVSVSQLDRAIRQVRNRARYYPSWPEGEKMEAEFVAGLLCRKFRLQPSQANLRDAVNAVVTAAIAWEGERPFHDFLDDQNEPLVAAIERKLEAMARIAATPRRGSRVRLD